MGARSGGGGGAGGGRGEKLGGASFNRAVGRALSTGSKRVSGTAKSEYNQKQEIQAMGLHVLTTMDHKGVIVYKPTKKGNSTPKYGVKFDSVGEAYSYFVSKQK